MHDSVPRGTTGCVAWPPSGSQGQVQDAVRGDQLVQVVAERHIRWSEIGCQVRRPRRAHGCVTWFGRAATGAGGTPPNRGSAPAGEAATAAGGSGPVGG